MKIRNAELCDLPYLLEMLENAKASLRALGIDQWQTATRTKTPCVRTFKIKSAVL